MLAQKDEIFEETCDAVFTLNQDDKVRYWCEAREEGKRIERTYQAIIAKKDEAIKTIVAKKDAEIAEKDALIAKLLAEREESRK